MMGPMRLPQRFVHRQSPVFREMVSFGYDRLRLRLGSRLNQEHRFAGVLVSRFNRHAMGLGDRGPLMNVQPAQWIIPCHDSYRRRPVVVAYAPECAVARDRAPAQAGTADAPIFS
jgi:hypothetical protein